MSRRPAVAACLLTCIAGLGLTACGSSDDHGTATGPVAATSTTGQPTLPPKKSSAPKPKPPPASPVDAACPYVQTQFVMDTIGQHLTRTTMTPTQPHPACAFYRPDGNLAASITVTEQATPVAAQNAALSTAGKDANSVNVGDYGVSAIQNDGALVAATKGASLVVVQINQQSSLEARTIAQRVLAKL